MIKILVNSTHQALRFFIHHYSHINDFFSTLLLPSHDQCWLSAANWCMYYDMCMVFTISLPPSWQQYAASQLFHFRSHFTMNILTILPSRLVITNKSYEMIKVDLWQKHSVNQCLLFLDLQQLMTERSYTTTCLYLLWNLVVLCTLKCYLVKTGHFNHYMFIVPTVV